MCGIPETGRHLEAKHLTGRSRHDHGLGRRMPDSTATGTGAAGLFAAAAVTVAGLLALPAALAGQAAGTDSVPTDSLATLRGRVVSALTGGPLENAHVQLLEAGRGGITDSTGRFSIVDVPPGDETVKVRLIGFSEDSLPIDLRAGHTTEVTFLLDRNVLRLEEINVTVDRPMRDELQEFYHRKEIGLGWFIGPGDIERRQPQRPSDLLRTVPGVDVMPVRFGKSFVRFRRAVGNRRCEPALFVDGVYTEAMDLDDIDRSDLLALELYRGPGEIPAEFTRGSGNCGAIVAWTRVYGDPRSDRGGEPPRRER